MTPDNDIYKKRDFLLGEIHERTECIPQIQKDICALKSEVAIIKWKSGVFGTIGGFLAMVIYYFKDYFLYGGRPH